VSILFLRSAFGRLNLLLDYIINKYPEAVEIREIAGQWNIDDFRFYLKLEVSAFLSVLSQPLYSHFRNGFLDSEWLNKKLNKDEIRRKKLQLSLDLNLS
jgi:hypothetical protein